jgi:hypothetical protein
MTQDLKIGQRIQYLSDGWKPKGVIIDKQKSAKVKPTSSYYKVRWDNGQESGWLPADDLQAVDQTASDQKARDG